MNNSDMKPDVTYTTLDGRPLAHPQPGVTIVRGPMGPSLLYLGGVFIGPPPPEAFPR